MLTEAMEMGDYYRNDQQWCVLYAVSHPHLVSLDVDNKFFLTTRAFRGDIFLSNKLTLILGSPPVPRDIGLLHCNNRYSNKIYDRSVSRWHVSDRTIPSINCSCTNVLIYFTIL